MNTILIIFALLLMLAGIVGSVLPGIPGPPLSWLALLLVSLSSAADYQLLFLVLSAVAAVAITILDYVVPSVSTKRFGGGRAGVWGCNIGLILSLFGLPFGPQGLLGVIFWPFAGAFIGELIGGKGSRDALRAAWGAFIGFLTGTGLKLAYALTAAFFIIRDLIF